MLKLDGAALGETDAGRGQRRERPKRRSRRPLVHQRECGGRRGTNHGYS
jgi:hypothetical protein